VNGARLLVTRVRVHLRVPTRNRSAANSVLEPSLTRELQTLVRSSSTTDNGVLAVKVLGDFLERCVLCLDEELDDLLVSCRLEERTGGGMEVVGERGRQKLTM